MLKKILKSLVGSRKKSKTLSLKSHGPHDDATYVERHAYCAAQDVALDGWHNLETGYLVPDFFVSENDSVLDVGCGGAGHSHFCLLRGASVTFTDIDAAVVESVQRNFLHLGLNKAKGIVSNSCPIPVEDESVTKIIATEVLEHVEDVEEFMQELYRVGKPGAQYFITVPHAVSENMQVGIAAPAYFEKPNHIRIIERDELERLVTNAGLVIESYKSYGAYWTIWWLFFWNAGVDLSNPEHPMLDAWTKAWSELLKTPNALRIKSVLDRQLPKSQVIIARKK